MKFDRSRPSPKSRVEASKTPGSWVTIIFRVTIRVPKGYFLCVIGSCPELGQWRPKYGRVMEPVLDGEKEDTWQLGVMVRRQGQIRYRYFICTPVWAKAGHLTSQVRTDPEDYGTLVPPGGVAGPNDDFPLIAAAGLSILCWESFTAPRILDIGPNADHVELPMRTFAYKDQFPKEWSRGWLVGLSRVRLTVHGCDAITLKALDVTGVHVSIRCIPMDCSKIQTGTPHRLFSHKDDVEAHGGQTRTPRSGDIASNEGLLPCKQESLTRFIQACKLPVTTFSSFRNIGPSSARPPFAGAVMYWKLDGGHSYPRWQPELGVCFDEGDCLNFDCDTTSVGSLGFRFDFHVAIDGQDMNIYLGYAFMLPPTSSGGQKKLPIFCPTCRKVGEFNLTCLVVNAMPRQDLTMENNRLHHWNVSPLTSENIRVGHSDPARYKNRLMCTLEENTMASFKAVAEQNVSMVKFDVQLTADKVPVVYKSLTVPLTHHRRCRLASNEIYCLKVHNLTTKQLQSTWLPYHSQNVMDIVANPLDDCDEKFDPDDLRPFPTLQQCLASVDPSLGFNIVVKYPHNYDGGANSEDYFDRNLTIDIILGVILANAGNRKVVLSSCDPDNIIMMQLKQNRYPVLFLTEGLVDTRCHNMSSVLFLAQVERLLGINLHVSMVLRNPSIIRTAHMIGLTVFVWGQDIHVAQVAELLAKHNVSVVTSDRMDFAIKSPFNREVFKIDNHLGHFDLAGARVTP